MVWRCLGVGRFREWAEGSHLALCVSKALSLSLRRTAAVTRGESSETATLPYRDASDQVMPNVSRRCYTLHLE